MLLLAVKDYWTLVQSMELIKSSNASNKNFFGISGCKTISSL
jgi:hypothetical protein